MAAAAVAMRTGFRSTATRQRSAACGLAFTELGGPLVAVCGLAGGAGTTTLALALARQAAIESSVPILVSELAPRGALAVRAGTATPLALGALARSLGDGRPPGDTFVELVPRLRLIATMPQVSEQPAPDALAALLGQARGAHGLVVIDCATDWSADSPVLESATQIIWTLPATAAAVALASVLLAGEAAPAPGRRSELLAATAPPDGPSVRVRSLRRLARQSCRRLVLVPHDRRIAANHAQPSDVLLGALTAVAPVLRRTADVG